MPAKPVGKTAAKRDVPKKRTAKKSDAKGTVPVRAGPAAEAAPHRDPQLERKTREAEERARQLADEQRDLTAKVRDLERELDDARGALQSRSEQLADGTRLLEATKREVESLRDKARANEAQAAAARRISESAGGKLRCPRCSGPMTEYQHDVVRADRCDDCHGIYFDNGELEQVVEKTLKDHDARKQGGWFSSLFGRR